MGKDRTIHASIDGVVAFGKKNYVRFDGRKYLKTFVSVLSYEEIALQAKDAAAVKTEKKVEKSSSPKKVKAETKKAAPKAVKKEEKKTPSVGNDADDLTKIEGIGPKIQEVFQKA